MYKIEDNKTVAQGDMQIMKIDQLPDGLREATEENGEFILTHSETGHHHVVKKQAGVKFYENDNNPLVAYLVVDNTKNKEECFVEHKRHYDTHQPYVFTDGVYIIRRQIESDDSVQGWRRALD